MRIKQIVSHLDEVDVRNLRQQANLNWVRIKNTPPAPFRQRGSAYSSQDKAPGLSAGQRASMFLPQELPSCISPPEERLQFPSASLEDLRAGRLAWCNSSELKPS